MSNRAKYGQPGTKDKVWDLAKPIKGKDPNVYKQDSYGNQLYKQSYGKTSAQGWEVDHIKPKARNGSNDILNLQALSTKINREKSDTLVKRSRHNQK